MFMVFLSAQAADPADNSGGEDRDYGRVPEGTLVWPGEREATGRESTSQRKCMKVCKEWGESCIIDPRTGVRKCRRSCKQFGVECF